MAIDTLMTGGSRVSPAFGIEHRAVHQQIIDALPPGVQYVIDPSYFEPRSAPAGDPASFWAVKHQNAHDTAISDLPPFYGSSAVGMNVGQNLVDLDLEEPTGLTWALFVNLQLHYAAMLSIGP